MKGNDRQSLSYASRRGPSGSAAMEMPAYKSSPSPLAVVGFFTVGVVLQVVATGINSGVGDLEWQIKMVALFSLVLLVFAARAFREPGQSWVNPPSLFLCSFLLFTMGQTMLSLFGVKATGFVIEDKFTDEVILRASVYTVSCFSYLVAGVLIAMRRARKPLPAEGEDEDISLASEAALRRFGFAAMIIGAPFFLNYLAEMVPLALAHGYAGINDVSLYSSTTQLKVSLLGESVFKAGIFCALLGLRRRRGPFWFIALIVIGYSSLLLLAGERTESTAMLIILLWLARRYGVGKVKPPRMLLVVLVLALLAIYPAIMAGRNEGFLSVNDLWTSVVSEGIVQSITDSVSILGYSMYPLIETMRLVPDDYPFRSGMTYLAAVTAVIPYQQIPNQHARLGVWLQDSLSLSYGPGYSIPAEAYINFGMMGPLIAMPILGYIVGRFMCPRVRGEGFSWVVAVPVVFLVLNLTLPRREILGSIRDIGYIILPMYFILRGFINRGQKR